MSTIQVVRLPEKFEDNTNSLEWMKKYTSFIVSSILYLRKFLADDAFCVVKYETIKLRVLSKKCQNESVQRIIQQLQSCFDALEKNYLKKLSIGIFKRIEGEMSKYPVELYEIEYASKNLENLHNSVTGESDFKKNSSQILKNLFISLKSMPLPSGPNYLLFKIDYYEQFAPSNYNLNGFIPYESSLNTLRTFELEDEYFQFNDGSLNTGFHSVGVRVSVTEFDSNNMNKSELCGIVTRKPGKYRPSTSGLFADVPSTLPVNDVNVESEDGKIFTHKKKFKRQNNIIMESSESDSNPDWSDLK